MNTQIRAGNGWVVRDLMARHSARDASMIALDHENARRMRVRLTKIMVDVIRDYHFDSTAQQEALDPEAVY